MIPAAPIKKMKELTGKIRSRYNPTEFAILCQLNSAGSQNTPPLGMEGKGEWYQPERDVDALRCRHRL